MSGRRAGLTLLLIHLALVGAVGAKLLADRARLPRAWARTVPYDPDLPIRGRYVRLRLEVPLDGRLPDATTGDVRRVSLLVRGDRLAGVADERGASVVRLESDGEGARALLQEPVAYFIPEHVPDPSVRSPGEELWAEVTLPRRGGPRPIRLGVRRGGVLSPLELR
jgi:hypothetical protein